MSLRALSTLALERDTGAPRKVKAPRDRKDAHGNVADVPDPLAEPHSYADALVSAPR